MNQIRCIMYNKELKQEAVLLSYIRKNVDKVASDIGIDSALLHGWRENYRDVNKIRIFEKNNLNLADLKSQNEILRCLLQNAKIEHEKLRKLIDHDS